VAQTTIKGQDVERALRPGLRHSQSIVLRRKQSFGATLGPVARGAETRAAGSYKWEPTFTTAFSKYCFKKKTKFLVRHLGRLPEEQKQGLLVATNGSLVAHGYTKKVLGTADD